MCESEVAQSSDSWQPHGLQPTRLLRPWDFPGKSTGVGCHCPLRRQTLTDIKGEIDSNTIIVGDFNTLLTPMVAQTVKHLPVMLETWVQSLGGEDLLEKAMATSSSILAWKIP